MLLSELLKELQELNDCDTAPKEERNGERFQMVGYRLI